MSVPGEIQPSAIDAVADHAWHCQVRVILGPHPAPSEGQRKAVEADYDMTGGVSVINVRASFLRYFLKRFGIEESAKVKVPQDQHIILLNRKDVMDAHSARQEA